MDMNIDTMRKMQTDLYIPRVIEVFGNEAVEVLEKLLGVIVQIYRRIDPGLRTSPLVVFCEVQPTVITLPTILYNLGNPDLLQHEVDDACAVQVVGSESLHVRALDVIDVIELSKTAIVYRYHNHEEQIIVSGRTFRLSNPAKGYPSTFCRPTFTRLIEALRDYHVRSARDSSCQLLQDVWANQGQRWHFRVKPEETMRKSLTQYLNNVLQDAEVRPEQMVDESHPVDIKVTWLTSSLRAIIEIKWLGDSMDGTGKVKTCYRDARAREGATQLAEYLDGSRTHGSNVRTRGYLVIFDGRRRGLSETMAPLSHENGMHYRDQHIIYAPDYNAQRDDFEVPVRMFLNPICT